MIKLAINGTGRIGLCTARIIGQRDDIELVALNSTAPIDTLLHLLRYDSIHGKYDAHKIDDNTLQIDKQKRVKILSDRDPSALDFGEAQGVIECTGKFNSAAKASAHIKGNVKKVIISAPAEETPTFVYGVNEASYKGESVISNASCTTNCLAPIAKVLNDTYGIESALMTTIHSYTNDQNLLDVKHKDLRRARAAALSMIPTSTGAAKAVALVIPELAGKFNGYSMRVPTPDVSLVDLSANLTKPASKDEINELFRSMAKKQPNIFYVDDEQCVSSDFIGTPYSAIIVPDKTSMIGSHFLKILAWYDNEMGYSTRLVDMSVYALTH
ncbi:type I glyceraldehyde-3-phosphate dehydrogenase [Helicobacter sp. CLO-3]|uniref:type I glyceraldehyde-3-phosphate dehydrogenase n=1 Tax=unclassified Helicobacter TaxID=2593540 RepID=UPI00080596AF|nr:MULTISPECIES: type I glyceraldehyde-3-phosphate dehydrogenase [unclassified Helicobacter]OBV28770.1 type I glyceraldehyde-3-phosphate dehydrogenase [Helicobacter sp. CLO-3]OHU85840.1 type I glyceraldehyde-3-phosphate dehydrogenase [Helicobacter sp. CLO-3]